MSRAGNGRNIPARSRAVGPLGGLLTGALLGRFLAQPARHPEAWTRRAGQAALAITFAGGTLAIYLMIFARV